MTAAESYENTSLLVPVQAQCGLIRNRRARTVRHN